MGTVKLHSFEVWTIVTKNTSGKNSGKRGENSLSTAPEL